MFAQGLTSAQNSVKTVVAQRLTSLVTARAGQDEDFCSGNDLMAQAGHRILGPATFAASEAACKNLTVPV